VAGVFYKHTTGAFSDIDLINWSMVEYKGKVNNFTLTPRTQEDYYNFQFEGYLYISRAGSYQFQTYSDDGSRVTIDNTLVVDNDGRHAGRTISGNLISLNSGPHVINVKYFEYNSAQTLIVRYKGPDTGNNWLTIPDVALRSGNSTSATSTMMAYDAGGSENLLVADSLETETEAMRSNIYPNPARPSENITLQVTGSTGPVRIKLADMMGRSYYEKILTIDDYERGFEIMPQQALTSGIYILLIQQGTKTRKQTLIVKE
jgi:hypothetical protein